MRFSKISITKKGVHLTRETKDANGAIESVDLESPERPLAEFSDALQSFVPFVTDLLMGAVTVESDDMRITTLNLSEDKNGLRGLIVTAIVPVPNAYDKPLVVNTPLVREGGENPSDDAFVLSDEVLELIKLAESEATRYVRGERVQGELFNRAESTAKETGENVREFDEAAAHAEVTSTRKPNTNGTNGKHPKGKRGRGGKAPRQADTGVSVVVNEPGEQLDDAALRQLLLSVDRDVPIDAIALFTSSERDASQAWAEARQKEMIGQLDATKVPAEPNVVIKFATLPLKADEWTSDSLPPKASEVTTLAGKAG